MSLISRIVKGLKKVTLKKALPYIAGAAALAVPGVGGAIAGAGVAAANRAGSLIKGAARNAGSVITGVGVAGGALADTATAAVQTGAGLAGEFGTTMQGLRQDVAQVSGAAGSAFGTSAVTGAIQPYLPLILIGAGIFLVVMLARR